jgi:hypothetical protein
VPRRTRARCLDRDGRAEAVHGEPLGEAGRLAGIGIEKDRVAFVLQEEVGEVLALRRQDRGIDEAVLQPP